MCICMYIHIYICIYIYIHVHAYTCLYIYMYMYTYIYIYTDKYVYTSMFIYIYLSVCVVLAAIGVGGPRLSHRSRLQRCVLTLATRHMPHAPWHSSYGASSTIPPIKHTRIFFVIHILHINKNMYINSYTHAWYIYTDVYLHESKHMDRERTLLSRRQLEGISFSTQVAPATCTP